MNYALEIRGLCRAFGSLKVTSNVDLALLPGARAALIGPNGAGKTTLINLITGALKPSSGSIHLNGSDITTMNPSRRVLSGLVRTFQITKVFKNLTVADNFRMAIVQREQSHRSMFRSLKDLPGLEEEVGGMLTTLGLGDRAEKCVSDLAYGEQRLVELGLALALKPQVLLLDEPAAGVPQSETEVIVRAIENLPGNLAVLLIEHDMDLVFKLATDIHVLVAGAMLMRGSPQEVASDSRVRSLYLGDAA